MIRSLGCVLFLFCAGGCDSIDVVVASPPDGGFQTSFCSDDAICGLGKICDHTNCGSIGTCRQEENDCDDHQELVCGCNGVTYWNDCLRRKAGASLFTLGECEQPRTCIDVGACPGPNRACAFFNPSSAACGSTQGNCWVMPDLCPATSPLSVVRCGTTDACISMCDAIVNGTEVFADPSTCP